MIGGYYSLGDEHIVMEIGERSCTAWCPDCGAPVSLCVCIGEELNPFGYS